MKLTKKLVKEYEELPYEEKKIILEKLKKEYGYKEDYISGYLWHGKSYRPYLEDSRKPYRMATKAYHMLGDISRDEPDLCYIWGETTKYYIGAWKTGYGMMSVKFPKSTTRKLTQAEADYWRGQAIQIASQQAYPVEIDDEDVI